MSDEQATTDTSEQEQPQADLPARRFTKGLTITTTDGNGNQVELAANDQGWIKPETPAQAALLAQFDEPALDDEGAGEDAERPGTDEAAKPAATKAATKATSAPERIGPAAGGQSTPSKPAAGAQGAGKES